MPMLAMVNSLAIRLDRSLLLDELGIVPDDWQRTVLRSKSERMLLNCHRQAGKSVATAVLSIGTALHEPDSLVLLVSASLRQSGELFLKVTDAYRALGSPIPANEDNAITLGLENGSRIVSLPDSPETIRGFSGPRLIVVDEASVTSDATFVAISPMLAISRGRLVAMSTPMGKRGWWYEAWQDRASSWERIEFKATENPRVDPAWLEEQRKILGPRWFAQEYLCSFEETIDQIFSTESIEGAFTSKHQPLPFGSTL